MYKPKLIFNSLIHCKTVFLTVLQLTFYFFYVIIAVRFNVLNGVSIFAIRNKLPGCPVRGDTGFLNAARLQRSFYEKV